ncbi:MAG: gliding motility-associated C-terminal domain-containing protein [Bacteroidetes bacterium]|nr:MAG: gliding motility-associated C-terminal domain-containing protein [Bacteroidota bacterium]
MLKQIFYIILIILLPLSSFATHIVGGEISMTHQRGTTYEVALILYFDAVNGNVDALDQNVVINIFDKSNNRFIERIALPIVSSELVPYTNPSCGIGDLVTRRIVYRINKTFTASQYANTQGYYMSWERCCRNGVIDNITQPGQAGQVFYMEFPAMLQGRTPFINSSPQLFPPLSDYACVGRQFYFNFGGKDPDGDELRYSLSVPMRGFSNTQDPRPTTANPAPYPLVSWKAGYDVNKMVTGTPALQIDKTGLITVTPNKTGLFVFSIRCDEYRNNVKIGTVIRDFQMLVIDCKFNSPPTAQLRLPNSTATYNEKDTIIFKVKDNNKCLDLVITDNEGGEIEGRILSINGSNIGTVTPSSGTITNPRQGLTWQACVPDCPGTALSKTYIMDIIVQDKGCSVGLTDTVRVIAKVINEPNNKPAVKTNLSIYDDKKKEYTITVKQGENLNFNVLGDDVDKNTVISALQGIGFSPTGLGMTFTNVSGNPPLTSKFNWKTPCNLLTANELSKTYNLQFVLKDDIKCGLSKSDTIKVKIIVENKAQVNNPPKITANLKYDSIKRIYSDTIIIGTTKNYSILTSDKDLDSVAIAFNLKDFPKGLESFGWKTTKSSGLAPLFTTATFQPNCNLLSDKDSIKVFEMTAKSTDFDLCNKPLKSDSTTIRLVVIRKSNKAPSVTTSLKLIDKIKKIYSDTLTIGQSISFDITGDDLDKDSIFLTLRSLGFDYKKLNMKFDSVAGKPVLTQKLTWKTDCTMLTNQDSARTFKLKFLVNDFRECGQKKFDSVTVNLVLKPILKKNTPPIISSPTLKFDTKNKMYIDTIEVGTLVRFNVLADDLQKDSLLLTAFGKDFKFSDLGMKFTSISGLPILTSPFEWQTSCKTLDLAKKEFQKEFVLNFVGKDYTDCRPSLSDTTKVKLVLRFKPTPNVAPVISANNLALQRPKNYFTSILAGENINFQVLGTDVNADSIEIQGYGVGFKFSDLNMKFTSVSGIAPQTSNFSWQTDCKFLNGSPDAQDFRVVFVVRDKRACGLSDYDTIRATFNVKPIPNNNKPTILAELIKTQNKVYEANVSPNQNFVFKVIGDDLDKDQISITASGVGFNLSDFAMNFPAINGIAPQSGNFTWTPTCDMLAKKSDFQIKFFVNDKTLCKQDQGDTILVNLKLKDIAVSKDFLPANVFTPNGDGKNDKFSLPNLPPDNCQDEFLRIEIYNRWGKSVFESNNRNFEWEGKNFPDGVYFYTIFFKNSQFRGSVSLIGGGGN